MIFTTLISLCLSYLIGSINSAIIICKCFGLASPRSVGSGNPGATNVLRLGSKSAAAMTLVGDVLKGVIPMVVGHFFFTSYLILGFIGLAAVLGHLFPIWFRFQGGKGVATSLGVLIGIDPLLGVAFIFTWLIIALFFRYSSLAALVAITLSPFYGWLMVGFVLFLPLAVIAIFVIARHNRNIKNLLAGTESKIKLRKS